MYVWAHEDLCQLQADECHPRRKKKEKRKKKDGGSLRYFLVLLGEYKVAGIGKGFMAELSRAEQSRAKDEISVLRSGLGLGVG